MEKIKIHELAKQLGVASKEIVSIANELGANVKNHLSTIDEQMVKKIKNKFSKEMKSQSMDNKEKKSNTQEKKQDENAPVIIRRAVIISEEEESNKEDNATVEKSKKEAGKVVERKNNNYNIVYRNKPTKPMTASELFGLSKKKKEEPVIQKEELKEKDRKSVV